MDRVHAILSEWGLAVSDVAADGSCQFHALIASGGLDWSHQELRKAIQAYLVSHADIYRDSIEGDWEEYLASLLQETTWGDHVTLAVAAIIVQRPILIHSTLPDSEPVLIPTLPQFENALPIPLVHQAEMHYQAIQPIADGAPEFGEEDTCSCGFLLLQGGRCINPQCSLNEDAGKPNRRLRCKTPSSSSGTVLKKPAVPAGSRKCGHCGEQGHRVESCPHRTGAMKKNGARGSSCPHEYSNQYSYGPAGQEAKRSPGHNFRYFKQPSTREIERMTEAEAEAKLKEFKLLPPCPPDVDRLCYHCGEKLVLKDLLKKNM